MWMSAECGGLRGRGFKCHLALRAPISSTRLTMTGSVATGTRTTASMVPIACEACSCVSTEGRVFGACSMSMVSHESMLTVESISVTCGEHAEAQTPSKPRGSRVSSARLKVLGRSIIGERVFIVLSGPEQASKQAGPSSAVGPNWSAHRQISSPCFDRGYYVLSVVEIGSSLVGFPRVTSVAVSFL